MRRMQLPFKRLPLVASCLSACIAAPGALACMACQLLAILSSFGFEEVTLIMSSVVMY